MTEDELYTFIVVYLVLCGLVALVASARGKSPAWGFGLSLLISPLLGFLVVVLSSDDRRKCPHCGESIKKEATVCRHCHRDLAQQVR